ncbi:L,D-transpeptidase [Microcoleus sp. FACHB-68]|uniref:L,D-transpeptidase n=1 Tax=Microcoleus sp. FACHB-68 TaxID=2692826 RepID=UPI001682A639|nr:L,D-transpeptidase [Microcoleus sp. FACHB-68]MBD1939242.1 L,D-transpeptidase [Microcoleus sp. FACHB-68]
MNSTNNSSWWRRSGTFWAGASLIVSTFCAWSAPFLAEPAFADAEHNKIANAILNLQESSQRWIEIDLAKQRLVAWEGDKSVYAIVISTGKDGTPTPTGTFAVQTKHRVARMQGDDYDVPDVPFTMYYYGGYAIHGAYWHNKFGTPVSHGCTNVAVNHAEWLFNWADVGTPIIVHK